MESPETFTVKSQLSLLDERAKAVFAPLIPLGLGFVWAPNSDSPIVVEKVSVDGRPISAHVGTVDSESPLVLNLGRYPAGSKVLVEWTVRALNDINGIQASVRAKTGNWSSAKPKSPLKYLATYSGKKTYTIPQPGVRNEDYPV